MDSRVTTFFAWENKAALRNMLILTGIASLLIFLEDNNNFAFSQIMPNTDNPSATGLPSLNGSVAESQPPSGFVSNGKINTVIDIPNGKWLATGNWSIILNNNNVTNFETLMTWYNSSGTNAHTHELLNFRPSVGEFQTLPINSGANQIILKGLTDVGSNNRISWFEVPTSITINDRKVISISLDDNKTNHHFGGQPLLGIVDSFIPCSDVPGPNMELLPPCNPPSTGELGFGLTSSNLTFAPGELTSSNLTLPSGEESIFGESSSGGGLQGGGIPSGGIPEGGIPFGDQQSTEGGFPEGGIPPGGIPGQVLPPGGLPPAEEGSGNGLPADEQTNGGGMPPGEKVDDKGVLSPECVDLNIENITANGFETDPSDYHPPTDAIDGSSSTWWSYNGDNPWIEISLDQLQSICGLSVQWNKGDERSYSFEIAVSQDGHNYEKVYDGDNNKGSTELEIYPFKTVTDGKFVKLTVTDTSSKDGWASIQELSVLGFPGQYNQTGGDGIPPMDNQTGGTTDNQTSEGEPNGIPPGGIPPMDNQTGGATDNQTGGATDNQTGGATDNQTGEGEPSGIPPRGIPPGGIPPIDNHTGGATDNQTSGLINNQTHV
jgi:hypothetical protein